MGKSLKSKQESTRLKDTHVGLTPYISQNLERYLPICLCGYHLGYVTPSAFFGNKLCTSGCRNIRLIPLEERGSFDVEEIIDSIESQKISRRKNPTTKLDFFEEDSKKKFIWILDRGSKIYIPHKNKIHLVPEISRDHYKLYIN